MVLYHTICAQVWRYGTLQASSFNQQQDKFARPSSLINSKNTLALSTSTKLALFFMLCVGMVGGTYHGMVHNHMYNAITHRTTIEIILYGTDRDCLMSNV